ncbi:MAG: hypothetical protein ABI082_00135 [Dokdonella sp.]
MNTRTPLMRAAIVIALAAATFAFVHTSPTLPAHTAVSMSLDARAPMHATLLPVVSVYADPSNPGEIVAMSIAASEALPVTLLPTVYIGAHVENFAATPTPAAHSARAEFADATPALRTRLLPR